MSTLTPGLFGKLPAHGDFVRRGWGEGTVAALDSWLGDGAAAIREKIGEDAYAARMRDAPIWRGFVPAGMAGDDALQLTLAPSVDRVGRLFFLAAGLAGDEQSVWGHVTGAPEYAEHVGELFYATLAGKLDATELVEAIADAGGVPAGPAEVSPPADTRWWTGTSPIARPDVTASKLDKALLDLLLRGATP